jgi:hypothetical protein
MLEQLPFLKNLRRVSEYAGGHHERMDGLGYPVGLMRDHDVDPGADDGAGRHFRGPDGGRPAL